MNIKMKTIAISANTSWYLYNFRKNTIKSMLDSGYKVIAISPFDKYSQLLVDLGCEHINIEIDSGGTSPIKDLKTCCTFIRIFHQKNITVLLNFTPKNNIYGTLAARLFGVKIINNIAGLGFLFINESFASKIARRLYRFSQIYADKIFFQNEDDRTLFLKHKLAPVSLTARLPGSGVDLERFSRTKYHTDGTIRFLLVARMLYDKGVLHYVEAARELKSKYGCKVEFRLLGFLDVDNPSAIPKSQMAGWVKEGVVSYLGTSDQVEKEIAEVDCMVLPSFYREGVPKSLLEGAAMGKAIVTTNSVGCKETVDEGVNGFLCEQKSTESLVEKLIMYIELSDDERSLMGEKSRSKIEKEFDEKIVIKKYLDAIKVLE